MGSDVEMESEDEREERRNKEKKRDRSRSRSKDRGDKKKHKKHKKEKKKHRKRDRESDEGGDTGDEGGDTPEKAKEREATPEPKGEEGEIKEKRRSPEKKHDRKEYNRDRDDGDRRRRRSRSRSRDRHRDRSGSRERKDGREPYKREEKREKNGDKNVDTEAGKPEEGGAAAGGNAVISLSIEETNKLRAKLGLKPLNIEKKDEVDEHSDQPGVLIPGDRDKTRHLAPEHWGERDRAKKLREKLATNKDKRAQNRKLMVVKGLGESDSEDEDASKWIERQKNKTKLKEEAEKRAKAMEQLDEEFGVGDIVEERIKSKRQQEYSGSNLKGLRVEHSAEEFKEKATILTLK